MNNGEQLWYGQKYAWHCNPTEKQKTNIISKWSCKIRIIFTTTSTIKQLLSSLPNMAYRHWIRFYVFLFSLFARPNLNHFSNWCTKLTKTNRWNFHDQRVRRCDYSHNYQLKDSSNNSWAFLCAVNRSNNNTFANTLYQMIVCVCVV